MASLEWRNSHRSRSVKARSGRGMTHGGVRWNTVKWATSGWIWGTNWTAEAPVPITATRSPERSWVWSQRAEWKAVPSNRSRPSMAGADGVDRKPEAMTSRSAVRVPRLVSTRQRP